MKYALLYIAGSTSLLLISCGIKIPYFDKLTPDEVCGGSPNRCQPTSSEKWEKLKQGRDLSNNDYSRILGRKYVSVYEPSLFLGERPKKSDYEISGINTLNGSISANEKNDFKASVKAEVLEFLSDEVVAKLAGSSVNIDSEVSYIVDTTLTQGIQLRYFRVDLTDNYIDTNILPNMDKLENKEKVATGISVLRVSGAGTKKTVTDVFSRIEAKGAYRSLGASVKNEFAKDKTRMLSNKFEPTEYFFAVAFRQ